MFFQLSYRLYSILTIIVVGGIAYYADRNIVSSYNEELTANLAINSQEIATYLQHQYGSFREDISFLYNTPPIAGMARATLNKGQDPLDGTLTKVWKSRLEHIFISFIENNLPYTQLRILNAKGEEIVRVERANGKVKKLSRARLQDKSDRHYFQATSSLNEDDWFVSVVDLNREQGKLTFPYTPTLRFARPVYDETHQLFGIIIANIDMSYLLFALDNLVTDKYDVILTDIDGYFLKHPDSSLQFSRDLAPSQRMSTVYEKSAAQSPGLHKYHAEKSMGWWGSSHKVIVAAHEQGGVLFSTILLPDALYKKELTNRRLESLSGLFAVLLLSLFSLYFLSKNNARLSELLRRSEEAKAAVDVAEDAIITVDKKWCIISVNRAFERLFILHFTDIKNTSVIPIFTELGDTTLAQRIKAQSEHFDYTGYEWSYCIGNGLKKWFYTKVSEVLNARTQSAYAIVISDITVKKNALEKVEQANQTLEETIEERTKELKLARDEAMQTSSLKSTFISTISHEMRTPLNGIVGSIGLLKNENLPNKQMKFVQMADNSVEVLRRLINDILDLSKIEAGKLELDYKNFNPEALLESLASTMTVVATDKKIGFYIDTNSLHIATMQSDPHRLAQVINNLLNNAIKFTNKGYVYLKAWSEIIEETVWLNVEIQDSGIGISQSNISKLFQAFNQANETISSNYGGTGLGLSICKEIISLLGGTISVKSVEGQGSAFTFKVPSAHWEEKETMSTGRLANKKAGILTANVQLKAILKNIITANSGLLEKIQCPFSIALLEQYAYIFVDVNSVDYEEFVSFWQVSSASFTHSPKLIITGEGSHNTSLYALHLALPIYRSTFLSHIVDSRESENESAKTNNERRRSDITGDEYTNNIKIVNCHILVVDDNDINIQVASYILEPLGAKVRIARNGKEALTKLHDSAWAFDIVLMDCNMPIMNGYEATRAIRQGLGGKQHSRVPIIAMTANAMKGESEKCFEAGMSQYITKPIDPSRLVKLIKNALEIQYNEIDTKTVITSTTIESKKALWDKEEALTRLGGREALLKQIIGLFISGAETKFKQLKDAVITQEYEIVRQVAHAIKGNAGDVGATRLHHTLDEIEKNALQGNLPVIEGQLAQLETDLAEILVILNDYMKT